MPIAEFAMQRKLPIRLISIASWNCCIGYSFAALVSLSRATVLAALATPAQFTRILSWPWAMRALSNAAFTFSSEVTSTSQKRPPISLATCSPRAGSRSNTATLAPLRASSLAVASPSPDAAPVTTAATPLMFIVSPASSDYVGSTPIRATRPSTRPSLAEPAIGRTGPTWTVQPKSSLDGLQPRRRLAGTIDRGSRVRVTGRNLGYFGAATVAFLVGAAASAQSVSPNAAPVLAPAAADDVAAFYATFRPQPIWTRAGVNEAAVAQLVAILQRAPFD